MSIISEPTLSLQLQLGGQVHYWSEDNFFKELAKYKTFHWKNGIYFVRDVVNPFTVTVIKTFSRYETSSSSAAIIEVRVEFYMTMEIDTLASIISTMGNGDYEAAKNVLGYNPK